nr:MAG TPA: hypothetical protein [Caudoviricetes sp.]
MFRSKEPVAWDPRYFDSTIRRVAREADPGSK